MAVDYIFENAGTLYMVEPQNDRAREHLADNVQPDAQWLGGRLAVEHRYGLPLAVALNRNGWLVWID